MMMYIAIGLLSVCPMKKWDLEQNMAHSKRLLNRQATANCYINILKDYSIGKLQPTGIKTICKLLGPKSARGILALLAISVLVGKSKRSNSALK
jgi:hypothetical protein